MQIITTHKGADFDALASVVAANILYPNAVTVMPGSLNHNVRSFLSLHKDLFNYCSPSDINMADVSRLIVVDTNAWQRLDTIDRLKDKKDLEIYLYDHHGNTNDLNPQWKCQENSGANITLMLRYLKQYNMFISPIQASLFLLGIYEDTGNLTFPSTTSEDIRAAAFLIDTGADLKVLSAFLGPTYGRKQKEILFQMLKNAQRRMLNGFLVSINLLEIQGHVESLAEVVQMYRQILNVDAAFGIFLLANDRCLVIGRSGSNGIDVGALMRCMGGGGHSGAGSAMIKSVNSWVVAAWIRILIGEKAGQGRQVRDLMTAPVITLSADTTMETAMRLFKNRKIHGAPVMENHGIIGVLSLRDFRKMHKKKQRFSKVKAFMSTRVVTIKAGENTTSAVHVMVKYDVGRLPVIDSGQLVGIITRSDAMSDFYGLCPLDSHYTEACRKNSLLV
ncbi:MAG: CBS domain-containing protein [Deltaproteobacteria bacterium]|nr:CBS domain-containing protein [Deltaproteobacteria bacterium]